MLWVSLFLVGVSFATAVAGPPKYGSGGDEQPFFYKGYDLSSLKIMEDGGAVYKNAQQGNKTMPAEDILAGMNVVRLRLWVNPTVPFDDGCECSTPRSQMIEADCIRLRDVRPGVCSYTC